MRCMPSKMVASDTGVSRVQAGLLFVVEERLYSGEHEDMVSAAYPAFLVLASSGLGIALTARLAKADRVGIITAWALHCIYASKLAMLLVPDVSAFPFSLVVCSVNDAWGKYRQALISKDS